MCDGVSVFPLAATDAVSFGIGELSKEFGVTPRALRFYEEEGLIAPRRDGATRTYSRRDRVRIAWILRGKSVGFSLDEIGDLLNLYEVEGGPAKQRVQTALRCRARADALRNQLAEIEATIAQLEQFAGTIDR